MENQAPGTENQEPRTENQEPRTENQEPHAENRERRSRKRARRSSGTWTGRQVDTRAAPVLAPWPQAVPIVEVGMRIRTPDDQSGIVVDVQDTDGPLTYLVQLDGQATPRLIPARTLKGVQL